jgi:uncharacterized membrane protein
MSVMNKTMLFNLIIPVLFLGLMGCSQDDVDTEKPVIEVNEPLNLAEYHPGDEIHVDIEFSDNVGLTEFKIDIHYGGDHGHKSLLDEIEWNFLHIEALEGRNKIVQMHIDIPQNAKHGEYHFLVYCTDKAGNEAMAALEIDIEGEH